jgi:hypothetical protein
MSTNQSNEATPPNPPDELDSVLFLVADEAAGLAGVNYYDYEHTEIVKSPVFAQAKAALQSYVEREIAKVAQFNWICQKDVCGAYNPYDCRQCRVCGKARPKIYTEDELQAALNKEKHE